MDTHPHYHIDDANRCGGVPELNQATRDSYIERVAKLL